MVNRLQLITNYRYTEKKLIANIIMVMREKKSRQQPLFVEFPKKNQRAYSTHSHLQILTKKSTAILLITKAEAFNFRFYSFFCFKFNFVFYIQNSIFNGANRFLLLFIYLILNSKLLEITL